MGLFGKVQYGEINNLGLENVYINGFEYIGGLTGNSYSASIRNCYSKGVVQGGINCHYVGGLVGINYGDIINCYSEGIVISAGSFQYPGSGSIGGLVGSNNSDLYTVVTITDSWSSCDVIGWNGAGGLGGLAGGNGGCYYFDSQIINCYSTGTVRGYNSGVLGGLVGSNEATINKCFSTSPVIGEGASKLVGGLVGQNNPYGAISNCFSTGDVNAGIGSENIGGLAGYNDSYGAAGK